jgi:hypothetical protein
MVDMPIRRDTICWDKTCENIIQKTCPDIMYIPAVPAFFGHIYLLYNKTKLIYNTNRNRLPDPTYVCYNDQHLHLPDNNKQFILFKNQTYRFYMDLTHDIFKIHTDWLQLYVETLYRQLIRVQH